MINNQNKNIKKHINRQDSALNSSGIGNSSGQALDRKNSGNGIRVFNIFLLIAISVLFIYYIYQTNSITSNKVKLVNLNKKAIALRDSIEKINASKLPKDFDKFVKESLNMISLGNFDYLIIGAKEYALNPNIWNRE